MTIFDRYAQHVSRPYVDFLSRMHFDFEVSRAQGAVVEDTAGRKYIDCIGGYGNLNVGHNHPRVLNAVEGALEKEKPFGWPFISEAHVELAERLIELAPLEIDRCLIVNSGSEAVESALKLARLATGRSEVVCCHGGWHGFTLGALSVSEPLMYRSFGPLLPGVHRVPFGDAAKVEEVLSPKVGAVLVEPIQSENGGIVPTEGYLTALKGLCDSYGTLFVVDEIKTGMAKTGKMLACEFDRAEPDVILLGKSLGGGLMPIGAMLAKRKWWTKFGLSFAMTSSSAAGNVFASVAGLATLEVIDSEGLCANAQKQGERLREALLDLTLRYPEILRSVSGRGLLIGLHMCNQKIALEFVSYCLQAGIILMPAFLDHSTILIEPPLCISCAQAEKVLDVMEDACRHFGAGEVSRN